MHEDMFAFGNLLLQYRERNRISIERVCRQLGQKRETIVEWEESVSFPAISRLAMVAFVYEGDLPELRLALLTSLTHIREIHKRGIEAQKPARVKISRDAWGFIPSTSSGYRKGARIRT